MHMLTPVKPPVALDRIGAANFARRALAPQSGLDLWWLAKARLGDSRRRATGGFWRATGALMSSDEYEMPRPDALGEQHIRAFGYVIAYWASFESLLEAIIIATCGLAPETGRLFTGGLSYAGKRDLARAIARQERARPSREFWTLVEEVLDKAQPLADLRNLVAQATWRVGDRPGSIRPVVFGPRGAAQSRGQDGVASDFSSDDLHDEATGIFVLWNDLYTNAVKHGVLQAPLPKGPEPSLAKSAVPRPPAKARAGKTSGPRRAK
jgi:hypothetical protein